MSTPKPPPARADIKESSSDVQRNDGPSFFAGAQGFNIGNQVNVNAESSHVTINVTNISGGSDNILSKLNPIPDASHTRNLNSSPPDSRCLPGTRIRILKEIKAWADSGIVFARDDTPTHVLWLHGYVGCGKSAISQAIAETFAKKKRLAASYFFYRGSGDRSRSARVAQTLAKQLVATVPGTKTFVKGVLKEDEGGEGGGTLPRSELSNQVERLFLEPTVLTVIDGLDECEDRREVSGFIERIIGFFKDNPRTPLRFLISSRVEEHIQTYLGDPQAKGVYVLDLPERTTDEDVASVVEETFKDAAKRDWVVRAYGEGWPTPEDRRKLVRRANKSLIVISTLLKFILTPTDDGLTPKSRLSLALDLELGLDGLYTSILSRSENRPHFHLVVSTIALVQGALSIDQLTELLHLESGDVINVLVNLCSIFHVPGDDRTPVTPFHLSLREFLTTEERSGPTLFASPSHHRLLAYRFFEHMGLEHAGSGTYANYFLNHWDTFVGLHRDDHAELRQELRDLITHFFSLDPPVSSTSPSNSKPSTSAQSYPTTRRTYSAHTVISTYSQLDVYWLTHIAWKGSPSVGEFVASFLGMRESTMAWARATSMVDSVDDVLGLLCPEPGPTSHSQELEAIFQRPDEPDALPGGNLSLLSTQNVAIDVFGACASYLFVHHHQPTPLPIAFLPFIPASLSEGGPCDDPDLAGYAFWAFSRHLRLAIKQSADWFAEERDMLSESGDGGRPRTGGGPNSRERPMSETENRTYSIS